MAKMLRIETIAARRGVSTETVRRWIKWKGLPATRTAGKKGRGHWRVDADAFARWLADRGEIEDLH